MHKCGRRAGNAVGAVYPLSKMTRASEWRRGVTLVETLVAFALLAVVLNVLIVLMVQALDESAMARRRAQGILLAQERMEDILAHRADLSAWEAEARRAFALDPETDLYRFNRAGLDFFRWGWEIQTVEGRPRMRRILVRASWQRRRQKASWSTYRLQSLLTIPGAQVRKAGVERPSGERGTES